MTGSTVLATARSAELRRARRRERLAEVAFLCRHGATVAEAVAAVGWSVPAAEIAARRAGHELQVRLLRERRAS